MTCFEYIAGDQLSASDADMKLLTAPNRWVALHDMIRMAIVFLNPMCRSSQAQILPSIEIQVQESSLPDDKEVMNKRHTCMSPSDTNVLRTVPPIMQAATT